MVYESRDLGDKPQGKIEDFCRRSLSRDSTYHAPICTDGTGPQASLCPAYLPGAPVWTVPSVSQSLCPHHDYPGSCDLCPVTCKMSPQGPYHSGTGPQPGPRVSTGSLFWTSFCRVAKWMCAHFTNNLCKLASLCKGLGRQSLRLVCLKDSMRPSTVFANHFWGRLGGSAG